MESAYQREEKRLQMAFCQVAMAWLVEGMTPRVWHSFNETAKAWQSHLDKRITVNYDQMLSKDGQVRRALNYAERLRMPVIR